MDKKATLVLEDGTNFIGESLGVSGEVVGLLVLNTAIVGYQEIMTDPANTGKILILTYPLIGNYGINEKFNESNKVSVGGLVIKEESSIYSNWQANLSLNEFLKKQNVVGITGVDTRTLAVKMRSDGEMLGVISSGGLSPKELLKSLEEYKKKPRESVLGQTSVKEITRFEDKGQRVVVIDLGISKSILKQLSSLGLEVTLVPYDTGAKEILKLKPEGLIISNGPEDDPGLFSVVDTVKELLGQIPILGISTGHQVIAKSMGAEVIKMKIGHRGLNYPVKRPDPLSRPAIKTEGGIPRQGGGKGEITVQNHSFVVDEGSLSKKDIQITERNINDQTIERIESKRLKFISVQYYPLSPGLDEIHPVFNEFINLMQNSCLSGRQAK